MPRRLSPTATLALVALLSPWCCSRAEDGSSPQAFRQFVRMGYFLDRRNLEGLSGELFEDSDLVADDLDNDGFSLSYILVDSDGDGEADALPGRLIDYDDLHRFNVSFDGVSFRDASDPTSFELMKQHLLDAEQGVNTLSTGWRLETFLDDIWFAVGDEVAGLITDGESLYRGWGHEPINAFVNQLKTSAYTTFGLRGLNYEDTLWFEGRGSILGLTSVDQENDHYLLGPQVGVGAVAESGMWRFEATLLGLAGYGHVDRVQRGIMAGEAIPGATNRSATLRTTYSDYKEDEDHFAWHTEARLAANCRVSQHWSVDVTWRWFMMGPYYSAYDSVVWNIPNWGMSEGKRDSVHSDGLFVGVTYTR